MNQFKNGTLLVVIATAVTAVLILMTSRDNSSSLQSQNNHIVEDTITVTSEVSQVEAVANDVEIKPDASSEVSLFKETMTPEISSEIITAPEGPFNKKDGELVDNDSNQAKKITAKAAYIQPSIVVATTIDVEAAPEQKSQPIWMDQKLGDFTSVETQDAVFKIMPTSPNGLQGEDPQQVVTSKSDKFAPATVLGNYNYQQMPMYNGGYYIAPMPSYFMPSMLPGNPTNKK